MAVPMSSARRSRHAFILLVPSLYPNASLAFVNRWMMAARRAASCCGVAAQPANRMASTIVVNFGIFPLQSPLLKWAPVVVLGGISRRPSV
jgi:uncharacterized SAM-binding protein YcdF (DUF218 family)